MSDAPRRARRQAPRARTSSPGSAAAGSAAAGSAAAGAAAGASGDAAAATPEVRLDARSVAFALLRAVSEQDAYANLVLPRLLRGAHLAPRDAALATELAYGTLRGRGTYDAVLSACCDRTLSAVDPKVLDALRLGAHQLLATRTAAHAAVSETVDLVRRETNRGAAGFANAVLRRVARRDLPAWLEEVAPLPEGFDASDASIDAALAVRTSHPAWMLPALRGALAAHGRPSGELGDLLAADNSRPRVTLAALPGLIEASVLAAETDDGEHGAGQRGALAPTAVVLPGGDPAGLPAVVSGRARVQDEGSQLVALALLAAPVEPRAEGAGEAPERWLDLCAGPGGKAALLAASSTQPARPAQPGREGEGGAGFWAESGAHLTAVELAPHRARLVRSALAPLDASTWDVVVADGRRVGAQQPGAFDRVLLDAPCTGTGALRRRPEARWRRTPADLADLTALQGELLDSALAAVRPGGVVAYCTCSPLAAETVDVIERALSGRDDVELLDAPSALALASGAQVPDVGEGRTAQLWPHRHGTDAMFLALLRRR